MKKHQNPPASAASVVPPATPEYKTVDPLTPSKFKLEVGKTKRNLVVATDAVGNVVEQPAEKSADGSIFLRPFEDGALFRGFKNPAKEGTFILADAAGVQVAVVVDRYVADVLCKGARLFFAQARLNMTMASLEAEQSKPKIIS